MKTFAAALCLTLAFGTAATAVAGERSAAVQYTQDDLRTEAGVEAVYARLRSAASRVCSGERGLSGQYDRMACRRAALNRAIAQLNQPALTARHQGVKAQVLASN